MTRIHLSRALVACAVSLLMLTCPSSYGQDPLAEIGRYQERLDKLENDFMTSQRRILALASTSPAQDLTYDQLSAIANLLSSANRELGALTQSLMLAALVTDKRAIPQARRIVETQRGFAIKRFQSAADFAEKTLARTRDPETNRLILEARDLLKSSAEFVTRLKASDLQGLGIK